MKPLLLIGGGGHCKSCVDVIEAQGLYSISGILDRAEKLGGSCLNYEIIGEDKDLAKIRDEFPNLLITIGQIESSELRQTLFNKAQTLDFNLPLIISPRAVVSKHAEIGLGTIVMHQAVVNAGAKVGVNCIINSQSLIEHDVEVGRHCHISTGAILNGGVQVGDGVFVGSGAVIRNEVHIGKNAFIGMGARVSKDVNEGQRVL